jgi:hypothetical protein
MSLTAVVDSSSRISRAAAAARAASSSCACGAPTTGREVRALVAQRHVENVAAVGHQHPLRAPDEVVELGDRIVVVVVVDAAEADEHRIRRPQLGQELAAAGVHPLVDRRQHPLPYDLLRKTIVGDPRPERRELPRSSP